MKKSIKELREMISTLADELRGISQTAQTEGRSFSKDELKDIKDKNKEIAEIEVQIEAREAINNAEANKRKTTQPTPPTTEGTILQARELITRVSEGQRLELRGTGENRVLAIGAEGETQNYTLVENRANTYDGTHSGLDANSIDVATLTQIMPSLKPNSILDNLGCKVLNLSNQVNVPVAEWFQNLPGFKAEGAASDKIQLQMSNVALSPCRIPANMTFTKRMVLLDQAGYTTEALREAPEVIQRTIESILFGTAARTQGVKPAGLGNTAMSTAKDNESAGITYKRFLELRAELRKTSKGGVVNAVVVSPEVEVELRATPWVEGSDITVADQIQALGIKIHVTDSMPNDDSMYMGDFSRLLVNNFTQIGVVYDPFTEGSKGKVNYYFDKEVDWANATKASMYYVTNVKKAEAPAA